jgi:hypothetical protein
MLDTKALEPEDGMRRLFKPVFRPAGYVVRGDAGEVGERTETREGKENAESRRSDLSPEPHPLSHGLGPQPPDARCWGQPVGGGYVVIETNTDPVCREGGAIYSDERTKRVIQLDGLAVNLSVWVLRAEVRESKLPEDS